MQHAARASGPRPTRSASQVTLKPSPSSARPRPRRSSSRSASGGSRSARRSSVPSRSPLTVSSSEGSTSVGGVQVRREAEAGGVADEPQHPRGVVDERALVEHAQHVRVEVVAGPLPLRHGAVDEPDRDRVDGEVPPREVLLDRGAEFHVRQRPRPGVALAAGAREVEDDVAGRDRRGAEALVDGQRAADPLRRPARDRHRVTLHHQVQFARLAAQQRVAHRAADDVHARLLRDGGEHDLGAGGRGQEVHSLHCSINPPGYPATLHDGQEEASSRRRRGARHACCRRRRVRAHAPARADVSNPDVEFGPSRR